MAQYDFTVLYERNPFVLKKPEDIGKSFKLPPSNFGFEGLPQITFSGASSCRRMIFRLSFSGLKVFLGMLWQVGKMLDEGGDVDLWFDQITLNHDILEKFLTCDLSIQEPKYLNFKGFKEGIKELERNKILAKGTKEDCYFINPDIFGLPECDEDVEFDEEEESEEEETKAYLTVEYPNKRHL
ncbi:replication protein [Bartonella queenslandensis]|uniref:replication protein n=1 Tax=Bartonella queenslandensis TaxID=481138 RepID=UPI001BA5DA94|nr:replication protein [Bartonella queenslandensis]